MAKKVSLYGIYTALCLILGYIEFLLPLNFIAPGIKLGLANSIALLLMISGDFNGAMIVNITRIILSTILFSQPFSLLFSLPSGIISLLVIKLISKIKNISTIGYSVSGAFVHNLIQLSVAFIVFGPAVLYYSPLLLFSSVISGTVIGYLCILVNKKLKTNNKF